MGSNPITNRLKGLLGTNTTQPNNAATNPLPENLDLKDLGAMLGAGATGANALTGNPHNPPNVQVSGSAFDPTTGTTAPAAMTTTNPNGKIGVKINIDRAKPARPAENVTYSKNTLPEITFKAGNNSGTVIDALPNGVRVHLLPGDKHIQIKAFSFENAKGEVHKDHEAFWKEGPYLLIRVTHADDSYDELITRDDPDNLEEFNIVAPIGRFYTLAEIIKQNITDLGERIAIAPGGIQIALEDSGVKPQIIKFDKGAAPIIRATGPAENTVTLIETENVAAANAKELLAEEDKKIDDARIKTLDEKSAKATTILLAQNQDALVFEGVRIHKSFAIDVKGDGSKIIPITGADHDKAKACRPLDEWEAIQAFAKEHPERIIEHKGDNSEDYFGTVSQVALPEGTDKLMAVDVIEPMVNAQNQPDLAIKRFYEEDNGKNMLLLAEEKPDAAKEGHHVVDLRGDIASVKDLLANKEAKENKERHIELTGDKLKAEELLPLLHSVSPSVGRSKSKYMIGEVKTGEGEEARKVKVSKGLWSRIAGIFKSDKSDDSGDAGSSEGGAGSVAVASATGNMFSHENLAAARARSRARVGAARRHFDLASQSAAAVPAAPAGIAQ